MAHSMNEPEPNPLKTAAWIIVFDGLILGAILWVAVKYL